MEALLDDVGSLFCRSTEGRVDIPTNLVMVQLTLLIEHEAMPWSQMCNVAWRHYAVAHGGCFHSSSEGMPPTGCCVRVAVH